MDMKKVKLTKKIQLTDEIAKILTLQVEQVDKAKDNTLIIKTQLNGHAVYYKIVVSEIMKNLDEWQDLVKEYEEKQEVKKHEKK